SEQLRLTWCSLAYGFFKTKVEIGYDNGHKFHLFKCAAKRCKSKAAGVCRYQGSQDHATMLNLKSHATKCFGANAVVATFKKTPSTDRRKSIFATFAHLGQQAVSFSHCAHTIDETRAHIAQWCAENNRPMCNATTGVSPTWTA
ncbi:hypothetical protein EDB86DRAFT_2816556, partial [Lactarius hatsudake]